MLTYICFAIVSMFLIITSWGGNLLNDNIKVFILFIILSLLGMGVLSVFSKKQNDETSASDEYIKITKNEYTQLLSIKSKYEEMKGNKND